MYQKRNSIFRIESWNIEVCMKIIWKDQCKKSVAVISNMHDGFFTEIINRKNSKGEKIPIECPKTIADYKTFMGEVD